MRKVSFVVTISLALILVTSVAAQDNRHVPTIDELLTLKTVGAVQISPDGKWIAYTVGYGDFKTDAFVNQIWLADVATGQTIQLTRGDKSSGNPRWSPDGIWLTFLSNRVDDKNQIFAINPRGGESIQLTKSETAIGNFAWSEDGKALAYLASEPAPPVSKERKGIHGRFRSGAQGVQLQSHLDIQRKRCLERANRRQAAFKEKKVFSVESFAWSPDGSRIAFSATINPDLIQGATSDIYVLNLGDDSVRKIVAQPGPDSGPRWSPDGKQIVFQPQWDANRHSR